MRYSIEEILEIVDRDGDFEYPLEYMFKEWGVHSLRFKFHKSFRYDFKSGKLLSRRNISQIKIGDEVGWLDNKGYRICNFYGDRYLTHRIIMNMFYDDFDEKFSVDHINGFTSDNRLQNLRMVTHSQNLKNQKLRKNNTSGHVGIHWRKDLNMWRVCCYTGDGIIYGGCHKKIVDAIKSRDELYFKCGYHPNHGRRSI